VSCRPASYGLPADPASGTWTCPRMPWRATMSSAVPPPTSRSRPRPCLRPSGASACAARLRTWPTPPPGRPAAVGAPPFSSKSLGLRRRKYGERIFRQPWKKQAPRGRALPDQVSRREAANWERAFDLGRTIKALGRLFYDVGNWPRGAMDRGAVFVCRASL